MKRVPSRIIVPSIGVLLGLCYAWVGLGRDWGEPVLFSALLLVCFSIQSLAAEGEDRFGETLKSISMAVSLAFFIGGYGPGKELVPFVSVFPGDCGAIVHLAILVTSAALVNWGLHTVLSRVTGLPLPRTRNPLGKLPLGLVAFAAFSVASLFMDRICDAHAEHEWLWALDLVHLFAPVLLGVFIYRLGIRLHAAATTWTRRRRNGSVR